MRNLWLITKEDFFNLLKNPMWIFMVTGFPLLLVCIIGFLTAGSYSSQITSYDYYGVTLMIYAILNSGMMSANAFMEERIKKPNMRIIFAPGSVKNIYLSKIISSFLFTYLFHIADIIFLKFVFHITLHHIAYVMLLFGMLELFSVVLGIVMCCIVKTESVTNQIQSIIVNLLAIMGGVLFSMDGYGAVLRILSMISPVKWIVQAVFQVIYDGSLRLFVPAMTVMAVCIAVMLFVCQKMFHKEDCIC